MACAAAAAWPAMVPIQWAAAAIEETLACPVAGTPTLPSLPSSSQSLYLTLPESWRMLSVGAAYCSVRPQSVVTQEAAAAGVTPRRVAATEATPQLQDGRRWALGGYRSDHLRPALVSLGKAVAGWAAEGPLALATVPAGLVLRWLPPGAPGPGWHCRPVPPAARC